LIITSAIASEDRKFVNFCQEYITNATAEKVDGYSFVASCKDGDIAAL
jgi:succinate dehydrogenase flavin-adding protein (antitoxin of CptAB toxin-antitoxin module)